MKVPPRPGPLSRASGRLQEWVLTHGVKTVRLCIGVVYFWFGALKFAPVVPIEEVYLPGRVVSALTLGALDGADGTLVLAVWECFIGFCLVAAIALRTASLLMFAHLLIMFLPMLLWPRQVWSVFPFGLTLKGQIILDNLVMIACGMVLASSVPRGFTRPRFGRLGRWARAWDERSSSWMGRHGTLCLRIAMGTLYVWFGALKFFPGFSPLEGFATRTMEVLGAGLIPPQAGLMALAVWECLIGLALLAGRAPRTALILIVAHMAATLIPLFAIPREIWIQFPFILTLPGKYLIRHLALFSAAIVIATAVAQRASGWSAHVNPFLGRAASRREAGPRPLQR